MASQASWRQHLRADPTICHGAVCVAGTRIPASVVLDNLAEGQTEAELLQSYPSLSPEAVQACLAYAAELARETLVDLPA